MRPNAGMLPVLIPLAPASTLVTRFPAELATVLARHEIDPALIASEVAAMSEVSVAKTGIAVWSAR